MAKREDDLASLLADSLNKQNKDGKMKVAMPLQMLKIGYLRVTQCWM
jgi:hypothetical protein